MGDGGAWYKRRRYGRGKEEEWEGRRGQEVRKERGGGKGEERGKDRGEGWGEKNEGRKERGRRRKGLQHKHVHIDICFCYRLWAWQVSSVLRWSEKSGSHFRVKARVILQKIIRKFGYVCKWGGVAGIQAQIQPAYHCSHSQFVVARNQSLA